MPGTAVEAVMDEAAGNHLPSLRRRTGRVEPLSVSSHVPTGVRAEWGTTLAGQFTCHYALVSLDSMRAKREGHSFEF